MLSLLFLLLPLALFLYSLPLFTRRGVFFSASVDDQFPRSPEGRDVLRSYRRQVALWTGVAVVLALLTSKGAPVFSVMVPTFLLIGGTGFSYWRTFRQVHAQYGMRKPEIREAPLLPAPSDRMFSIWLIVPPFLLLLAAALYLNLHWNQVPQHFPVHYGINGEPDRWADRSWRGIYGPLLYGAYLNVFMLTLGWTMAHQSRRTAMRYVTVRVVQVVCYPISLVFALIAISPLLSTPGNTFVFLAPGAITLACVAGAIYWAYRKLSGESAATEPAGPENDDYWRAGAFYWNPDDPAIFVPKRMGIGYTVNFANKWAWVALAGILLAAVLPVFLFT